MLMCLVRGRMRGVLASSSAPELSSNAVHLTTGCSSSLSKFRARSSVIMLIRGMTCRSASDKQQYSASVVLRQISRIRRDAHNIGQPASRIRYPARDCAVAGSFSGVSLFQVPAKSASANTSNPRL